MEKSESREPAAASGSAESPGLCPGAEKEHSSGSPPATRDGGPDPGSHAVGQEAPAGTGPVGGGSEAGGGPGSQLELRVAERVTVLSPVALSAPSGQNRPTLFQLIRQRSINVPRQEREQHSFFRFLKMFGSDPRIVEQVHRFRDAVILSGSGEKTCRGGLALAVAGARGQEGASLLSFLLALSLGECTQRRVAHLDAKFNARRFQGLSELLALSQNSVNIPKGLSAVSGYYNELHANVCFLRTPVEEQSLGFFSDRQLGQFLADLRERFDFTILDMPALLKETAGLFVLPHVDRLYLVVEAGKTRLWEVDRCFEVARQAEKDVSGVIVNKQRLPWWSRLMWREFFL